MIFLGVLGSLDRVQLIQRAYQQHTEGHHDSARNRPVEKDEEYPAVPVDIEARVGEGSAHMCMDEKE